MKSDGNVSRETVLEVNMSTFSDICLSLDKLYSYLNYCFNLADQPSKEDIERFLHSARDLYFFSKASMNSIQEELDLISSKDGSE